MNAPRPTFCNLPCAICEHPVPYVEVTGDDPECPGFIAPLMNEVRRAYFGFAAGEDGGVTMIVCCSTECVEKMCGR